MEEFTCGSVGGKKGGKVDDELREDEEDNKPEAVRATANPQA